uniref:curli production assembly/transport protein CsgE n=1 Tax=Ningiella ruwaisensis TaxID=2364274 RepID=UPI001F4FC43C|nr:curli production assembly/transport protein CsgE [Ningiella ruwaisensis]
MLPSLFFSQMISMRIRYSLSCIRALVIACVCFAYSSHAQEIELNGLLLDNTISRQGHEFASKLAHYWREVPNTSGKNLLIKEVVVPQAGTLLTVSFDNKRIYQTYMGRRQTSLDERVEQAIVLILDAIAQADFNENNPDMADDEW